MNFRKFADALFAKSQSKRIRLLRIRNRDNFRLITLDLTDKFIEIISGRQRHHSKARRQRIHYGKALAANRACRTKNGELLHETESSFIKKPRRRPRGLTRGASRSISNNTRQRGWLE